MATAPDGRLSPNHSCGIGAFTATPFASVHSQHGSLSSSVSSFGKGVLPTLPDLQNDVLPPVDQTGAVRLGPVQSFGAVHSVGAFGSTSFGAVNRLDLVASGASDSPFMIALQEESKLSLSDSFIAASTKSQSAATAKVRTGSWCSALWLLIKPHMDNTWAVAASLAVASMAYCYSFYAGVVVAAFTCMPLAGQPMVPGEIHLTSNVWVADMQLQCYTGQHAAVAAVAAIVGIPMVAGYWVLLLALSMPGEDAGQTEEQHSGSTDSSSAGANTGLQAATATVQPPPAGQAAVAGGVGQGGPSAPLSTAAAAAAPAVTCQASAAGSTNPTTWHAAAVQSRRRLCAAVAILFRPVLHALQAGQRAAAHVGVDGTRCIGLSVWNTEHRWWWVCLRECFKFAVLLTMVANSMHSSYMQAPLVLLVVLLVAALTWQLQPGCSTVMNWLLYIMYCLWQLLALLVLVLAIPGVNGAAFGGVLLALVCLLMANAGVTVGSLVWRCVSTARQVTSSTQLSRVEPS